MKSCYLCYFCKSQLIPFDGFYKCELCSKKSNILVDHMFYNNELCLAYFNISINESKYLARLNINPPSQLAYCKLNTTDVYSTPSSKIELSFDGFPYHPDNVHLLINKIKTFLIFS